MKDTSFLYELRACLVCKGVRNCSLLYQSDRDQEKIKKKNRKVFHFADEFISCESFLKLRKYI